METSNRMSPTNADSLSSAPTTIWASAAPDKNYHMTPPHASPQTNNSLPSLSPDDSLRIAVFTTHPKSLQALSFLEQIPGIEIVGIDKPQGPERDRVHEQQQYDLLGTPSPLIRPPTAPHVLLDFTGEPPIDALGDQLQLTNTEIPGPYTASLLEKIVDHKNGIAQQMAQIEKLASIGTMASGILHDINNPLHVILSSSEDLLEEKFSLTVREHALDVLQATKRIIKMCQDLNLYARQSTRSDYTPVDLTHQLEEAMKVARFSVGMENMTIIREYSARPMILARSEEIVQIFVNLIINALQAMDGQGTLTLKVGRTDLTATISIGDTGPGIPQEHMRKIFEPFYTTKPPGKGTGLGLHSARALIEEYQGQILLHSVVGEGTIFCLEFPLSPDSILGQNASLSAL